MIHRLARRSLYSFSGKRIVDWIENAVPFLRSWHRFAYHEHFAHIASWERLFSGVYPDFATARAAIPREHAVGYDNPAAATFLGRQAPIVPSDYPMLFWLSRIFADGARTVFDFGGYTGITYNSYKPFAIYPRGLRWIVYDVPAIVAQGERFLLADPEAALSYTTTLDGAAADVLLAAGSLQFCERQLADVIATFPVPPQYVLVNKLPAGKETFTTLQNMGPAISPYRIFERRAFVASIEAVGYTLIDTWEDAELGCYIPFYPEKALPAFSGFAFRRKGAAVVM